MKSETHKFLNNYVTGIKKLPGTIFRLIFPASEKCYLCGEDGDAICEKCLDSMKRHEGTLCVKCGRQVDYPGLCKMCKGYERPYDEGAIAFYYQDLSADAMKQFKYENKLPFSDFFAEEMCKKVIERNWNIDIVTSVPMHPLKFIAKGYNPPALLAKKLSRKLDIKYSGKLLKRTRYTKSMSLLKGIDRMEHSKKNFALNDCDIKEKNVLVVDDVSTTGATLHILAALLKKCGAGKVYVIAACGDTHKIDIAAN